MLLQLLHATLASWWVIPFTDSFSRLATDLPMQIGANSYVQPPNAYQPVLYTSNTLLANTAWLGGRA